MTIKIKTYKLPLFLTQACGPLTQLAEYLPFKQRVAGSSPARPTTYQVLETYVSPSSSPVQDTGLSRLRQGFESPWGRHKKIRGLHVSACNPFCFGGKEGPHIASKSPWFTHYLNIPFKIPKKRKGNLPRTVLNGAPIGRKAGVPL